MNNYHINWRGDVEYCASGGTCSSTFGHFPTTEHAIAKRNILASQGLLHLAGVGGAGHDQGGH